MTEFISIVVDCLAGMVFGLGFYLIPGVILYWIINWLSEMIYGKC